MAGTLPQALEPVPHLTPMELKVLLLLCHTACWPDKALPAQLGVEWSTVRTHKERLHKKCKVTSRQQLFVKAVRWKLVACCCGGSHERAEELPPPLGHSDV